MSKATGIIVYTGACAAIIIITLWSLLTILENKLINKEAIEKRA
jgi:hypothetical protein